MRSHPVRAVALAASGALIGLVGVAPGASAEPETAVPAEAAPVVALVAVPNTTTLPLFGTPLTIDITTGPGGVLASVTINPADGFTATKVKPHKVAFVNEEGTAKVVVRAKDGGQRVEARAGSLGDLLGDGGWAGEIFPGIPASVTFTVADKGDGSPDITGLTVPPIAGVTVDIGAIHYSDDDDELEAGVKILFTMGEQSRWLSIKVEVETDDDDGDDDGDDSSDRNAKVRVSLSKITNAPLVGADAVGAHQWVGTLCAGDPATIDYVVAADGTISGVVVSPASANQDIDDDSIEVRFGDGERVHIKVKHDDGELVLRVQAKIRCKGAADPTVNVPIVTGDDDHEGDHDGDRHDGDGDGDHRDGDHNEGDGDHHEGDGDDHEGEHDG